MSKKHFEKLAKALRSARPKDYDGTWNDCVEAVAIVCQEENPLFKPERFYEACGGLE